MNNDTVLPDFIHDSFDNLEDILQHIDDLGLIDLDFDGSQADKMLLTDLGVACRMTNRLGKNFTLMVMPDDITRDGVEGYYRKIVETGRSIVERFYPEYKSEEPVSGHDNVIQFPTAINP